MMNTKEQRKQKDKNQKVSLRETRMFLKEFSELIISLLTSKLIKTTISHKILPFCNELSLI